MIHLTKQAECSQSFPVTYGRVTYSNKTMYIVLTIVYDNSSYTQTKDSKRYSRPIGVQRKKTEKLAQEYTPQIISLVI